MQKNEILLGTFFASPRRLLHLVELLYELVQLHLRGEPQPVDRVCPHVRPLPELLARLGEGHVGRDGRVDDGLAPLHRDDAVQAAAGVVEEGDVDGGGGGGQPGPLRLRVDVEHVGLAREDRLLAGKEKETL